MSYFRQFDSFDPINGKTAQGPCFSLLSDVLKRSRDLLAGRTREEIIAAAMSADVYIDNYWSSEKDRFIRHATERGTWVLGYLREDERNEDGVRGLVDDWPSEADDAMPSYPNEANTTEFAALQDGICSFLFEDDPLFKGGKEYEYFAVFALWKVADANKYVRSRDHEFADAFLSPTRRDIYLYEGLMHEVGQAVESICWAEHLKALLSLESDNTQLRIELHQLRKQRPNEDQVQELARKKISQSARKASDRRHVENRAMKADVREWYEQHRSEFSSASKAAQSAHDAKLVAVEMRTLYEWMLSWDRAEDAGNWLTSLRADRTPTGRTV